jgi:hypothetical protein
MPKLTLRESYANVKIVCDKSREPGLDNEERQAVNESLQKIANALNEFMAMKQAEAESDKAKENEKNDEPEDKPNENKK